MWESLNACNRNTCGVMLQIELREDHGKGKESLVCSKLVETMHARTVCEHKQGVPVLQSWNDLLRGWEIDDLKAIEEIWLYQALNQS